jgi:hypothetical protein
VKALYEMPHESPQDLAHARWRVRFFKHLVEEHSSHPYPQLRDSVWASEDASYREHLARAETALAEMESAPEMDFNHDEMESAPPTNIMPFPGTPTQQYLESKDP